MKYRAILSLSFAAYKTQNNKLGPTYDYTGKAIKTIDGDSYDECVDNVRRFLKREGYSLTKEVESENHS